jgi:hypothetical protein
MTTKKKTRIIVRRRARNPKTYKKPPHISARAIGVLWHIYQHLNSDGTYNWGCERTGDALGLGRKIVERILEDLETTEEIKIRKQGKDPATQLNRPSIITPIITAPVGQTLAKNRPRSPARTLGEA